MSPEQSLQFHIPPEFTQKHHDALMTYLIDSRSLTTAVWRHLFQGIDLLDAAQVSTPTVTQSFRQVYGELIERPFANQYIQQLLETKNVMAESPALSANFARQIRPILQEAGFWKREMPSSILLQGYCLYWWQSFSRGYTFELFIMRDLLAGGIEFQMHDIRQPAERYSPADLIVLDLLGDIKTSIYFLQEPSANNLPNDFYITRLYEKGRERTLVVFQKPDAWDLIDGGATEPGTLETILELLPTPIEIEQRGIMLVVVEYETWKQMVRQKQSGEGS
ncbi:MAG: hypothetical protein IPM53_29395 [Anaerolineaceae bacterium]|nr:hypothetical protein [Anaerolineaceae bacterium]